MERQESRAWRLGSVRGGGGRGGDGGTAADSGSIVHGFASRDDDAYSGVEPDSHQHPIYVDDVDVGDDGESTELSALVFRGYRD